MKQEHRLIAELYRFVAPFIDGAKPIYVSPDGQAAKTAAQKGRFKDQYLPDLWFTLVGSDRPTLVEAKVVDIDGTVLLMQSQLTAWRSGGTGAHKPEFWVASDRDLRRFYFWSHAAFVSRLDSSASRQPTVKFRLPNGVLEFGSVGGLALQILRVAH